MDSVDEGRRAWKREEKALDKDRLIMLCDGIFAIAITLLVLDVRLPAAHLSQIQFNEALPDLFNKVSFYIITFATIAGFWHQHHRLMQSVTYVNNRFTWLTFLFLAFIALLPATSNIIEGYGYSGAVIIYTVGFVGCGFSLMFLWFYASWGHRLVSKELKRDTIIFHSINLALAPTYFTLSLLLLFFPLNPPNIFWSWLLLPAFVYIVHHTFLGKLAHWVAKKLWGDRASDSPAEKSGDSEVEIRQTE